MRATDEAFMRAAIALARRGLGRTAPNPSVAALVVDGSRPVPRLLGRGLTAPGGRPHAEANAVAEAGEAARGATIYVTLEPCARRSQRVFGPSCTEIILESGIRRVVIGASDPSPFAAGEGAERLRAAGLEVVTGLLAAEAHAITAGHCRRVQMNRPFVTLKLARTADGFAGTSDGRAIAITGEESRARVHRLRAIHDAILTGIGTVLADDPQLDVRLPGMAALSPLRVVLDSTARLPGKARLIHAGGLKPVLVMTAETALLKAHHPSASVEAVGIPRSNGSGLDLAAVLGALAARGITRLMVEAGPTVANALAAARLIDETVLLTGPAPVGAGRFAIGPDLAEWLAHANLTRDEWVGGDRWQVFAEGTSCSPES